MPTAPSRKRIIKWMLIAVIGIPFLLLFWTQSRRPTLQNQADAPPHQAPSTQDEPPVPSLLPD